MNLSEGYRIMLCYLDSYYGKNKMDELGVLLGSMSLLSDNTPADPAVEKDWKIAVSQIVGQKGTEILSSDNVYQAMIAFLHNWANLGTDGTISELCSYLEKSNPQNDDWQKAVDKVLTGNDAPYLKIIKP